MIEITRILCPVDFSEYSDHALRYAMKMARWYGASVDVLHVMPLLPPSTISALAHSSRQLTARSLDATVARWREPDVKVNTELLESADPPARVLERAEDLDVDLIVAGSHGRRGLQRLLRGSVVEPLLHRSRRPVLVIPAGLNRSRLQHPVRFDRIVCPVDFASASLDALAYAFSIAEESNAHIAVVNVIERRPEVSVPRQSPDFDIEPIRAQAEANRLVQLRALVPARATDFCNVETAVMEGGASGQVLQLAAQQNADLIVIGVHGRSALDAAVFGSNAKDIVRQAHCPVWVVPAGRRRRALRAFVEGSSSCRRHPVPPLPVLPA